jgi:hypothetical protein
MENPFHDIVATQITQYSSRLPFEQQCAFYAALMEGVAHAVVAKASGLSVQTIGSLRAAGTHFAGQMRYPRVAAEWRRLGRDEFVRRYVTAEIHDRLRVANADVRAAKFKPRQGFNPRAYRYRGPHTIKDQLTGEETRIQIDLEKNPPRPGWKWKNLESSNYDPFRAEWRGDPRRQEYGFASSGEAYAFCRLRFAPTAEEMRDGSYDAALSDDWLYEQRKADEKPENKIPENK